MVGDTIKVNKSILLDYEKNSIYSIVVNVNDGLLPGVAQVLTVNISDVNEIPVFQNLGASVNVPEDAVSAADIYTVSSRFTVFYFRNGIRSYKL